MLASRLPSDAIPNCQPESAERSSRVAAPQTPCPLPDDTPRLAEMDEGSPPICEAMAAHEPRPATKPGWEPAAHRLAVLHDSSVSLSAGQCTATPAAAGAAQEAQAVTAMAG